MADLRDIVEGIVTVALIVFVTRWLSTAKGPDTPKTAGNVSIYEIKWPVRAVAYAAAALCLVFVFADLRADLIGGRWFVHVLFAAFGLGGVWFGTGVVSSDQNGISKRSLWRSFSFRWEDITEVRLRKRDGGAIELRGKARKLIIDSRFVAQAHLQREIEQHTGLQPVRDWH